jgi:dihydrofolate reductase
MARIVSNFFISLDGVVEAPNEWHFPYFDDAMGKVVGSGMETSTGMLMGRTLHGEWSQYWPQQGPDVPFAEFINGIPKYVLSHHGGESSWQNTTIISGPDDASVGEQVQALKDHTDGEIMMSGSATTVRWLIAHGLLDELALLVPPIAVAKGQRLFEDTGTVPLKLVHSETLPTGVLFLRYTPDDNPPPVPEWVAQR